MSSKSQASANLLAIASLKRKLLRKRILIIRRRWQVRESGRRNKQLARKPLRETYLLPPSSAALPSHLIPLLPSRKPKNILSRRRMMRRS
jgi:hypothetical protein